MKIQKQIFFFWGGGGGQVGGRGGVRGGGSQGGYEQRIEVFVKIKKKIGGIGVRVDVTEK